MKWHIALFGILGLLLLSISFSSAITIDNYTADIHLAFGNAVVDTTITFVNKTTGTIVFPLPSDATKLSLYLDGKRVKPQREDNNLLIRLNNALNVRFNYLSDELVDNTNFLATFIMPENVTKAAITVILPEQAVLTQPLRESISSGSIFPKPTIATTDGQSLMFTWKERDLKKGDDISFFVDYSYASGIGWMIALLITLIGGGVISVLLWKHQKTKRNYEKQEKQHAATSVPEKTKETRELTALPVEKYLKEDEEQVVNILKQREGSCEQGTLRVITSFSKAKLSGLLKELEDRNVIMKEKRGKKNLVFLREQQMNNTEQYPARSSSEEQ
ncbi:hypothetical protein HY488_02715 [Candidatus Woesearchaeota archaeon]|nr:hypothetical protein [Candidatus Woesearchaeota archaeon]